MEGFSEKQLAFAKYLLKRIGFTDEPLIDKYLEKMEEIHGKYYYKTVSVKRGKRFITQEVSRLSNAETINQLILEVNLKKELGSIKLKKEDNDFNVSATDLAQFDFCIVSYCISKSFEIVYITNEEKIRHGTKLHETLRLLKKDDVYSEQLESHYSQSIIKSIIINKIRNSVPIFTGHADSKKYFINKQRSYTGQPDYIFQDLKGKFFVVEEKYRFYRDNWYQSKRRTAEEEKVKSTFYSNHIIQLQSYIDYITEYPIEYGILIYWFYSIDCGVPYVTDFCYKVIKKGEFSHLLEQTYNSIEKFRKSGKHEYKTNVNANKCAACSVNKYCGHKTNTIDELWFPYNRYHMRLRPADYVTVSSGVFDSGSVKLSVRPEESPVEDRNTASDVKTEGEQGTRQTTHIQTR